MKVLCWFSFFTGATVLLAQRPLPEELAISRSITMQDEGEIQLTPAVRFFKLPDEKQLSYTLDAEYGISDRVEFDAEVPYEFRNPNHGRSVNGLSDLELSARYSFASELNAGISVVAPTGSREKELGEGRVALGPFFTAGKWVGDFNLQLNCAWSHAVSNGSEEPRDEFEYNVVGMYPIHDWFLIVEGNGETNRRRTKYYVTPEVVWRPKHSFQMQLAAPIGLTRAAGDYGIVGSVSFEFNGPIARDKN